MGISNQLPCGTRGVKCPNKLNSGPKADDMDSATTGKERWTTNSTDPQMINSGTDVGSSMPTVWRVCQETDGVPSALQKKLRDDSIKPLTKASPIPTNTALLSVSVQAKDGVYERPWRPAMPASDVRTKLVCGTRDWS